MAGVAGQSAASAVRCLVGRQARERMCQHQDNKSTLVEPHVACFILLSAKTNTLGATSCAAATKVAKETPAAMPHLR